MKFLAIATLAVAVEAQWWNPFSKKKGGKGGKKGRFDPAKMKACRANCS